MTTVEGEVDSNITKFAKMTFGGGMPYLLAVTLMRLSAVITVAFIYLCLSVWLRIYHGSTNAHTMTFGNSWRCLGYSLIWIVVGEHLNKILLRNGALITVSLWLLSFWLLLSALAELSGHYRAWIGVSLFLSPCCAFTAFVSGAIAVCLLILIIMMTVMPETVRDYKDAFADLSGKTEST